MAEDSGDSGFWPFALKLYGREGVKPALLYLQDEHRLNIPLFLFALWSGNHRRLEAPEVREYLNLATDFTDRLIAPLRSGRRWLKSQGEPDLYRQLLDTELACEKALMTRLEKRFLDKPEAPSDADGQGMDNAELYLRTAGICSDPDARDRLTAIYRQYRQLTTDN